MMRGTLEADLLKLDKVADAADVVYTKTTIGVDSHQPGFELKTAVGQSSLPPKACLLDGILAATSANLC